jgi:hypothetical protein
LQPAKAVLDLLLILRLGQFSLSNLNHFGCDCGLEKALDEAHEFSKVSMGTVNSTIVTISNSRLRQTASDEGRGFEVAGGRSMSVNRVGGCPPRASHQIVVADFHLK